jgi:purine nucleoside permease
MMERVARIIVLMLILAVQAQAADKDADHQYEVMVKEALSNPEAINYVELRIALCQISTLPGL